MSDDQRRDIPQTDRVIPGETRHIVMTLNGEPIYSAPAPQGPIFEEDLLQLATFVTDNPDVAQAWMDRPNPGLNNLTPREAVHAGHGQTAANILRSFIAL